MKVEEATLKVLADIELELRERIIELAKRRDYISVTMGSGETCSMKGSIVDRWLNVLRLLSGLESEILNWSFVHQELGRQDIDTLKAIHKAMD